MGCEPPTLGGKNKCKNRHGHVAEKKTAHRLGGRQQPGSGSIAGAKGDITATIGTREVLVENKSTVNKSFVVKYDILAKINAEALEVGRIPVLAIQFVNGAGKSEPRDRFIVLREDHFHELTSS